MREQRSGMPETNNNRRCGAVGGVVLMFTQVIYGKTKRQPENEEKDTGESPVLALLANGSSGRWSVTQDESTEGSEEWVLQIEGPSLHLCCEVADPDILEDLATVLEAPTPKPDVFVIGKVNRIPLRLLWDNEYDSTIV